MSRYNEGTSPFEGAELTEAYLLQRVSPENGELYFGNIKRWDIAQEDIGKKLSEGNFELFKRSPDYEPFIADGSAKLYFYSKKEAKLAELTYSWPVNNASGNVAIQSQFDEWYEKMQEQARTFVPGQHTISEFAKEEFYKQFAEE
jgi:hypothetical protein